MVNHLQNSRFGQTLTADLWQKDTRVLLAIMAVLQQFQYSSEVRRRMLLSSIPSAVANFASACKFLCFKNCLVFH